MSASETSIVKYVVYKATVIGREEARYAFSLFNNAPLAYKKFSKIEHSTIIMGIIRTNVLIVERGVDHGEK